MTASSVSIETPFYRAGAEADDVVQLLRLM